MAHVIRIGQTYLDRAHPGRHRVVEVVALPTDGDTGRVSRIGLKTVEADGRVLPRHTRYTYADPRRFHGRPGGYALLTDPQAGVA